MEEKVLKEKVDSIKRQLPVCPANPLSATCTNVIPPFKGKGKIKLIIIGQDPTLATPASCKSVTATLNLDKPADVLYKYISRICETLGMTVENVYATNVFKYFYTSPLAETPTVMTAHLQPNLELLREELAEYPGVPVITLGQPVLRLLTNDGVNLRDFWGYTATAKPSSGNFTHSKGNGIGREIFPFVHLNSMAQSFYCHTFNAYAKYAANFIC